MRLAMTMLTWRHGQRLIVTRVLPSGRAELRLTVLAIGISGIGLIIARLLLRVGMLAGLRRVVALTCGSRSLAVLTEFSGELLSCARITLARGVVAEIVTTWIRSQRIGMP